MAADLTRAVLLFRAGEEQDFPIPDGKEVRLGFGASNELRLPFEGVSRSHARILRDEKGYWIEDAGSANGTFLNGQRVIRRRRLEHLDVLRFGRWHRLIFIRKAAPAAPVSRRGIVAAWLETLDGPEPGRRRDVPRGTVTLGRSPAANVQADSHLVSKLHARIERTAGQLSLMDLQSSNGTFVNGKRVESQVLADGDEINLGGSTNFRVHIEEGDVPSGESKMIPLSNPDSRFPFPSDWKTKIEWSPEDLAAMQRVYRDGAAATELALQKAPAAAKPPGPDLPPQASTGKPQPEPAGEAKLEPPAAVPAPLPPQPAAEPRQAPAVAAPPTVPGAAAPASPPVAEAPGSVPAPPTTAAAAPPAAPELEIESLRLEGKTRTVTLGPGDHLVGRIPESALRLEGRSISRRHALLRVRTDGASVTDLESANGTYVNAHRVTAVTPLAAGDEVKFGEVPFVVRFSGKPAGNPPIRK
jgi:pSer/pThr/pTyr-binding forkhead associated (FHA) protein